jgi:hypothetical protein
MRTFWYTTFYSICKTKIKYAGILVFRHSDANGVEKEKSTNIRDILWTCMYAASANVVT